MIRLATNSFSWHPTYNRNVPDLPALEICRQARRAGADGIEMDPSRIGAAELAELGLALCGASTGGPLYDDWTVEHADKVVSVAAGVKAAGGDYVFFTAAPRGGWGKRQEVPEKALADAGERFNVLARRVRAEGVAIGLHNHADFPGGLEAELALLRRHTDPALVGAYLDLGWAFVAGGDPAALAAELLPRCIGFHFRNHRGDKAPAETLSEGAIDMAAAARAIKAGGYSGWVGLELWHREDATLTKSMVECQAESLRFLRGLFGI